jgi:hypothetical protein
VIIKTKPTPGRVLVDGEEFRPEGDPPQLIGLSPGDHELRFLAPGHVSLELKVSLIEGESQVIEQRFTEAQGKLTLLSKPAGAWILLDGKRAGRTPRTLEKIPAGRAHQVTLTLPRFRPLKFAIQPADWPEDPTQGMKIEKELISLLQRRGVLRR